LAAVLPSGYSIERERGAEIAALPSVITDIRAAIRSHGTLYDWAAAQPAARSLAGRGAAYAAGDRVVRHYRRGGLVARVLYDRYLRAGEPRPLRELRASATARARGVATPEVLAAVVYDAGILMYRADIATRLVPDAIDLAEAALGPGRLEPAQRVAAWRAAGALLRSAFAAGVIHRDLNLRNILIGRDGTAHLLDLDRADVRSRGASDGARRRMLERLHRSRRKLEVRYGVRADDVELRAFDDAVGP
jgi:3-deoxy-D-manno-octulosonic acid kinase